MIADWKQVVAILLLIAALARAEEAKTTASFELTCKGTIDGRGKDGPVLARTDIRVRYAWTSTAKERVLSLQSMATVITNNGHTLFDYALDRDTMKRNKDGRQETLRIEDLPAAQREALHDAFGKPIAIVALNPDRSEAGRKVVMTDAARKLLGSDELAANILFFHPPAPPAGKEWSANRVMVAGDRGMARGEVKYTKTADVGDKKTFAASGELTLVNKQPTDERLKLSGEATFDGATAAWTSSRYDLDFAAHTSDGDFRVKMTYASAPVK